MKKVILSVFTGTYTNFPILTKIKYKIRQKQNYFCQNGDIDFDIKYNEKNKEWEVKAIISLPVYKFIFCLIAFYPMLFIELTQSQGLKESLKFIKNNLIHIKHLNKKFKMET